jgi:DNA-binding transcriptional MerR regulator
MIDLTIDQVSQIVGVPKARLRYWEKIFEVQVKRTAANRRRYPPTAVEAMQFIKQKAEEGYASQGIKKQIQNRGIAPCATSLSAPTT